MRKIEQQMIDAIRYCKNWKSGNTEVRIVHHGIYHTPSYDLECQVLLDDNLICSIWNRDYKCPVFNDCGWQTATTKSRINAILNFCSNYTFAFYSLCQEKGQWYLGKCVPVPAREHNGVVLVSRDWRYQEWQPGKNAYVLA